MRVLVAGGVFRLDEQARASRQATPEITLRDGLLRRGVEVQTAPLERVARIALSRATDLVHVHHLSKAAVAACGMPRRHPVVFTAHSTELPARHAQRAGLNLVARRADALVCLSHREQAALHGWFPETRSRTRVIANGISLPRGAQMRVDDGGPIRMLFVGQLIAMKRVDRIIGSLVDRPRLRLRLVYHNDHLLPVLQSQALALGVADRVEFVGLRSGDALYAEYRQAHLLALPSDTVEALPSVVTEAMATALPVVASDIGGVSAQLAGSGVLTDLHDDTAFGRGLDVLLADYATFAARALVRSESVHREFSVDAMVSAHLDLYISLLGGAVR